MQKGGRQIDKTGLHHLPTNVGYATLTIRLDGLIRSGAIASYSEVAELGHVTRTRISQIMNLLNLLPTSKKRSSSCRRSSVAAIR